MRKYQLPTVEDLRQMFDLRADGTLIWKPRPWAQFSSERAAKTWNARFAGKAAGSFSKCWGYIIICLAGDCIRAHRIVWALTTGAWPVLDIDHLNGNRADNRPENLREATRTTNARNRVMFTRNTSGVSGVFKHKKSGKWEAQIGTAAGNLYLGRFDTIEEAAAARKAANAVYGYTERHGQPQCA